jgi:phosphoglucomutase
VTLCGEESFGTSSSHAREKDGLWAVLFWLNLLAVRREPVAEILRKHWAEFGRDFFLREDYFIPASDQADRIMHELENATAGLGGRTFADLRITRADNFSYTDPVDGSVSRDQGIRLFTDDGGRIAFRLSGTGTRGATLRVYLERHETDLTKQGISALVALAPLASAARLIARIKDAGRYRTTHLRDLKKYQDACLQRSTLSISALETCLVQDGR